MLLEYKILFVLSFCAIFVVVVQELCHNLSVLTFSEPSKKNKLNLAVFAKKKNVILPVADAKEPNVKSLLKKSLIVLVPVWGYVFLQYGLNIEYLLKVLLYSALGLFTLAFIHFYFIVPTYHKNLNIEVSNNIGVFAQEVSYSNYIRQVLLNTKKYAHPKFSYVCSRIVIYCDLGMGLEPAIIKVIPEVKNQMILLFLSVLIIHDRKGGQLDVVLKNLTNLFEEQNKVQLELERGLYMSKIVLVLSVFFSPIVFLAISMIYKQNIHYFWSHPIGILLAKVVVFLYICGVSGSIYLNRSRVL